MYSDAVRRLSVSIVVAFRCRINMNLYRKDGYMVPKTSIHSKL